MLCLNAPLLNSAKKTKKQTSTTMAGIATLFPAFPTHMSKHSTDYDSNRTVHVKSTDIGTGHTVKRTRQPEEPEYTYRNRHMSATQVETTMVYLNEQIFFYKHFENTT